MTGDPRPFLPTADVPSAPAPAPVRLGDIAPRFRARSTLGPVDLGDFRGRWVLLFSHPADFTPVCTSEFVALTRAAPQFDALGCALLGLSVDSLYAHLAWIEAIQVRFGVTVSFPLVEDPSLVIARAYGMLDHQATSSATVRTSVFIDPAGIVRAISCYPVEVGRSVAELLRMAQALQATSSGRVLAPEAWQPGRPLLHPPAQTAAELQAGWFHRLVEDGR